MLQTGETVLAAGYTTGQLLILRKGLVAVTKEGVEVAKVKEPGAVFGEISALLDQPHSACARLDIIAVSRRRRVHFASRPSCAVVRCSNPGTTS